MKSKLRFYHLILRTPKNSPDLLLQTVVEKQRLQANEEIDPRDQFFLSNVTTYIFSIYFSLYFKTHADKVNVAMYRY